MGTDDPVLIPEREEMPDPPPGWGVDEVTRFLDIGRLNAFAAFHHWPSVVQLLVSTNQCFAELLNSRDASPQLMPGLFALRSQSAFLGGAACALSGQNLDAYLGFRAALEAGMYAVYVKDRPELEEIWLRRHESDEARSRVRGAFAIGKVLRHVNEVNAEVGTRAAELYELTIDLGAHPNQLGIFRNLEIQSDEIAEVDYYELRYLSGGNQAQHDALMHSCNTGYIGLGLLRCAIPHRFTPVGVRKALDRLHEQRRKLHLTIHSTGRPDEPGDLA